MMKPSRFEEEFNRAYRDAKRDRRLLLGALAVAALIGLALALGFAR